MQDAKKPSGKPPVRQGAPEGTPKRPTPRKGETAGILPQENRIPGDGGLSEGIMHGPRDSDVTKEYDPDSVWASKSDMRTTNVSSDLAGKTLVGMGLNGIELDPALMETQVPDESGVPVSRSSSQGGGQEDEVPAIQHHKNNYYDPIRGLGQGGMGTVFVANHVQKMEGVDEPVNEELVAIKMISFNLDEMTPEARAHWRERFVKEITFLYKLRQDNVIRILDCGTTSKGQPWYAMEFLDGNDLSEKIYRSGPLELEETKDIILQVCEGLIAAHEYVDKKTETPHPIIHRDIKPANIFLVKDGLVKVLDFGLAKIRVKDMPEVTHAGEGQPIGTPEYMSPEQSMSLEPDHRTDIYAVGATMYEMLSGRTPIQFDPDGRIHARRHEFGGSNSPAYANYLYHVEYPAFYKRVQEEQPPSLRQLGIDVPEEIDRIVMKCLEKRPSKRYKSMRELKADIERCEVHQEDMFRGLVGAPSQVETAESARKTIPRGPDQDDQRFIDTQLRIDKAPTMIQQTAQKRRGGFRRLFLYGVAGALSLGALAGVGGYFAFSGSENPQRTKIERTVATAKIEPDMRQVSTPIAEEDAGMEQDAAAQAIEHRITVKTNVRGVKVFLGDEEICGTNNGRECSFTHKEGAESVELVFRRPGYHDLRESFVPDRGQTVSAKLRPLPARPRPSKLPDNLIITEVE